MSISYCLPIIKKNDQEVLKLIRENSNRYDYFEIWLDYVSNMSLPFVKELLNEFPNKLIFLFRRKGLEPIEMDINTRKEIIDLIQNQNVFLDLDIETQPEELEYIKKNKLNVSLILSYHNYETTPKKEDIMLILEKMEKNNPTIYKISTLCTNKKDALLLLNILIELKDKDYRCIILGMGREGVVTRIFGTLYGNEMIFAPIESSDNSAPGQLTRNQLEEIFKELL